MKIFVLFFLLSVHAYAGVYCYYDSQENTVYVSDRKENDRYCISAVSAKFSCLTLQNSGRVICAPVNPFKWYETVKRCSQQYNIEISLIMAIIHAESGFRESVVSKRGAVGLMQLMPETAGHLGVDPYKPKENIEGGVKYFSDLFRQFNDIDTAIAAYNSGPGTVKKYGGIPPFNETRNFVSRVKWFAGYYAAWNDDTHIDIYQESFRLFSAHRYQDSLELFRKIYKEHQYAEVAFNIGVIYEILGEKDALTYYLQAISKNPFLKEAYYNAAICCENSKDYLNALSCWSKIAGLTKSSDEMLKIGNYIREIKEILKQEELCMQ